MKINKLKINSYGKLKEKEINLENGINLIYGENEAGKSTLIKFIINSFYGISKNKKGKEFSDYEKYKPWTGEEFSGKINYELDNKEKYELFRDFNKKNPKIFNENMEEITKEFNIDKNKGNEFFYEQTKIDEDLFLSTLAINQKEVKLEKQTQNILIQKIANLVGTGDDNISYKRAIDRINRRQLDEIGSERSREKPINIISRKIEELENEKEELEKYRDYKYNFEDEENNLNDEILKLENENNFLIEIKLLNENEKIEKEKINIKENIEKENLEKINIIKNKINEIKINNKNIFEKYSEKKEINNKNKKIKNKLNKKLIINFLILILINILQFIIIKNKIFNYIFFLTVPIDLIFSIILINNKNKKIKNKEKIEKNNFEKINQEIINLENEKNILEKNSNELENEINKLKNNFNLKINLEKEKIKNKYLNKIEKNKINNYLNLFELEKINFELENLKKEINNLKLKLHSLDLDKKNIEPKLDNLSKIEEKLVYNNEQKVNLQKLNLSIMLAKQILEKSYDEMKNSVTPKFTENLSKNISRITNGKYSKVKFNEETGLVVELENGDNVLAEKLSVGTIDQLYLSLRLSMVDELSEEKVPILLDEAFAFYDNSRLENILKYLNENYKNRQIIIFTCTDREKNILNKNNILFNYIEL